MEDKLMDQLTETLMFKFVCLWRLGVPDGVHPRPVLCFCAALYLCYECVGEHVRVDGRHSQ